MRFAATALRSPSASSSSSRSSLSSSRKKSSPAMNTNTRRRKKRRLRRTSSSSSSDDDEKREVNEDEEKRTTRRETLINLAFLSVSLPLWKDVFHDLGFYSGPDDLFADVPSVNGTDEDVAIFAGGCFWCMEETFEKPEKSGFVRATTSGYAGGSVANPKYLQVCKGTTGHKEVVRVLYDRSKISYKELLFLYFRQIDPTRDDGMFLDGGEQYASAIYVNSDEQKKEALEAIERMETLNVFRTEENAKERNAIIKTKVVDLRELPPEGQFFPAEIYHQDYFEKNKARYSVYRFMSGRDPYTQNTWQNKADVKFGGKEKAFEAIFK
jgi:peptide methionine sulfoxide reductase msrA/msrB